MEQCECPATLQAQQSSSIEDGSPQSTARNFVSVGLRQFLDCFVRNVDGGSRRNPNLDDLRFLRAQRRLAVRRHEVLAVRRKRDASIHFTFAWFSWRNHRAILASEHYLFVAVETQLAFELFSIVAKNAFLIEDWLHPRGVKTGWVDLDFSLAHRTSDEMAEACVRSGSWRRVSACHLDRWSRSADLASAAERQHRLSASSDREPAGDRGCRQRYTAPHVSRYQ